MKKNCFYTKGNAAVFYPGFTLIELLIVMVLVGTLVGIALPKYQRALERGRALEGIAKVKYAAEYAAVKSSIKGSAETSTPTDVVKSKYFTNLTITGGNTAAVSRDASSGWSYTLTAVSDEDGQITSLTCTNGTSEDHCTDLGLVSGDLLK